MLAAFDFADGARFQSASPLFATWITALSVAELSAPYQMPEKFCLRGTGLKGEHDEAALAPQMEFIADLVPEAAAHQVGALRNFDAAMADVRLPRTPLPRTMRRIAIDYQVMANAVLWMGSSRCMLYLPVSVLRLNIR